MNPTTPISDQDMDTKSLRHNKLIFTLIYGIIILILGYTLGYFVHGNMFVKSTDSNKTLPQVSQSTKFIHDILQGEYSNAQTVIMKQKNINKDGTTLFENVNNIVYFNMSLPSSNYCFDNIPCNYRYGEKYTSVSILKFIDITNESLPNVVKLLLPNNKTKPLNFSNYNGIQILDIPIGAGFAQSAKEVWFVAKDNSLRNIVYMIHLIGWSKDITEQEFIDILNSITITYH